MEASAAPPESEEPLTAVATASSSSTLPPQLYESSLTHAANFKKRRIYPESEIVSLLTAADEALKAVDEETRKDNEDQLRLLRHARELSIRAGLSIDSDLPSLLRNNTAVTTAGHSNTDHRIIWTGDYATDRTAALRRNLLIRNRYQCPETKGDERWDKPRIPGERRRRIVREKDLPGAPPIPPPTGYVIFVGQMTSKWRHDRPNERHEQARVVQEISKIWRIALSDEDHRYYNDFAEEARAEYKRQHMEFRATGYYTPSEVFDRPTGAGLWVRKKMEEKNDLERELATYETLSFPPRPPELDEEHVQRTIESKMKRKLKLQQEWEEKRKIREEMALKTGTKLPKRRRCKSLKLIMEQEAAAKQANEAGETSFGADETEEGAMAKKGTAKGMIEIDDRIDDDPGKDVAMDGPAESGTDEAEGLLAESKDADDNEEIAAGRDDAEDITAIAI